MVNKIYPSAAAVRACIGDLMCRFDTVVDPIGFERSTAYPSLLEVETMDAFRVLADRVIGQAGNILSNVDVLKPVPYGSAPEALHPIATSFNSTGRTARRHRDYTLFMQPLEQSVAALIRQLAALSSDSALDYLAANQARWIQDLAYRQARVATALNEPTNDFQKHLDAMRRARASVAPIASKDFVSHNAATTNYLHRLIEEKLRDGEWLPQLIIIHDFDDSLTIDFDQYKAEVPLRNLMTLSRLCLDGGDLRRARVRMSLLAGLMELPSQHRLLQNQLQRLVTATQVFDDAMDLIHRASAGVQHRILSANFSRHVSANCDARLMKPLEIIALRCDSYRGPEKVLCLLESVLENPSAIHVVVDDSDHRLVNSIRQWTPDSYRQQMPPIEDLAIFCARSDPAMPTKYELHTALSARNIIHGVNQHGYQAVTALVQEYGRLTSSVSLDGVQ